LKQQAPETIDVGAKNIRGFRFLSDCVFLKGS